MRQKVFVKYDEIDENEGEEDEQAISTPGWFEDPAMHRVIALRSDRTVTACGCMRLNLFLKPKLALSCRHRELVGSREPYL